MSLIITLISDIPINKLKEGRLRFAETISGNKYLYYREDHNSKNLFFENKNGIKITDELIRLFRNFPETQAPKQFAFTRVLQGESLEKAVKRSLLLDGHSVAGTTCYSDKLFSIKEFITNNSF